MTTPAGAAVVDVSTGQTLGTTPVTLDRPAGSPPLSVRFELKGYEPLSREFPTSESLRVELPLKKLTVAPSQAPKPTRVVTDGVLDPF
jgi:hypothetical protein